MKKILMILAAAGFLVASNGNLYANDNLPGSKSKKVKQKKDGSTTTKKKEVKDDGSSVKKTKKSSY